MMAHRKSFYANTVYPAQAIQRDKRNLSHFSTSYLKLGIRWLVEILVSASKFMSDLKIFSEYFRWSHLAREPLSAHPWSNQNSVTFAWNSNATVPSGITRGGMGEQFPGRRMIASGAENSHQCHKYFPQYSIFASERPQFRTQGRQTCFLPQAPSSLVTPLTVPKSRFDIILLWWRLYATFKEECSPNRLSKQRSQQRCVDCEVIRNTLHNK